jgi:hypothetical protein
MCSRVTMARRRLGAPLELLAEALLDGLRHRAPEDGHDGVGREWAETLDRVPHVGPFAL